MTRKEKAAAMELQEKIMAARTLSYSAFAAREEAARRGGWTGPWKPTQEDLDYVLAQIGASDLLSAAAEFGRSIITARFGSPRSSG